MQVNAENLRNMFTGFSAAFAGGLGMATSQWAQVAMRVPSSTRSNEYGWMGQIPNMREWIGDRVINGIAVHDYTIRNKPWELTIGVDRDDIQDDNLGIFTPLFTEMGRATAAHQDQLVFSALKNGFTEKCYDGQPFFDTEHPVLDEDGNEVAVSNFGGGSGTPWFLIDDTRAIKALILQMRKEPEFVARDEITSDNVFNKKRFEYGTDARYNVGYGLWQVAFGSKQTLDQTSYAAARTALMGMKGDHGRPLGLMPSLLVVPPTLEKQALELLNAERNAAGATNVYRGTARLLISPWLA